MAKMLTARSVERLKPDPKKRREISDGGSGLYFVIQPDNCHARLSSYEKSLVSVSFVSEVGYFAHKYAHAREAGTYVDSGIGLVKTPTGVREQP